MEKLNKNIYPLLTPILGLFPAVIFFVMNFFFSYNEALLGSLVTFALFFLIDTIILKNTPSYTIRVLVGVFICFILLQLVYPFDYIYKNEASIMLEVLFVVGFSIFFQIKGFFREKIARKIKGSKNIKVLHFDSDVYVIRTALFVISTHLLIVLVYHLLPSELHTSFWDATIHYIILFILLCFHFIFEFFRFHKLSNKISEESWLPIINEHGAVQGRVAWSVSKNLGDKYLHPIIRIALINQGKIYLTERPDFFISQRNKLDYPLESYLLYGESLDDGVKNLLGSNNLIHSEARYIFRYNYKNIETNRMIYLYSYTVNDDEELESLREKTGRFWTSKQIEENLNTGLFSEYFEKEYELLNNTVLLADRLMNKPIEK
ncbi:hypothetical protein LJB98_02530 [Bacteroidales bacterium OttesenSCG-928-M11]|nr:hypothetical protein [Bacteroidales bacterium OttesenSCG-928-M11]